jgi:hypothetical protein
LYGKIRGCLGRKLNVRLVLIDVVHISANKTGIVIITASYKTKLVAELKPNSCVLYKQQVPRFVGGSWGGMNMYECHIWQ